MNEALLFELVESVVDGDHLDWDRLQREAKTERERVALECLRTVAGVAAVHRTGTQTSPPPPGLREQPWEPAAAVRNFGPPTGMWGHFALRERVGAGAFGEVFRALDTHLGREVAIKLLFQTDGGGEEPTAERLVREAQAVARIRHENVVTVYGVETHDGRAGLCMEYLGGQTLDRYAQLHGRLGAREAAMVGGELCRALASVHAAGLLHCDVKARNVMRTSEGRFVLMDFGAGLLVASSAGAPHTGTPAYLAPEVLEGMPPTAQSDIYSLGVLLFFLVTGRYPVQGSSLAELLTAHRTGRREHLLDLRPDLPDFFVRAVEGAIHHDRSVRFETAGALGAALSPLGTIAPAVEGPGVVEKPRQRLQSRGALILLALLAVVAGLLSAQLLWKRAQSGRPAASDRALLAVLPFRSLAGGSDPLADLVTEDVRGALGRVKGLLITGWRSVERYRSPSAVPAAQIASELKAGWIVDGSIRAGPMPGTHAIDLVMFDARGREQWSASYDTVVGATSSLPRSVLASLVAKIGLPARVLAPEPTQAYSDNPNARAAYSQARFLMRVSNPANFAEARALLERAVALDPQYGLAYVSLADCISQLEAMGAVSPLDARREGMAALRHALQLEDDLPEAHALLASFRFHFDWDWEGAGRSYRRALQLNPSLPDVHRRYAYYQAALGQLDDALEQVRLAQDVDPWSPNRGDVGMILYYARRYDEAVTQLEQGIDQEPDQALRRFTLGRAYAAAGRFDAAIRSLQQAIALAGGPGKDKPFDLELARAHAQAGHLTEARTALAIVERDPALEPSPVLQAYIGYVYAALGDTDRAFSWLERAAEHRAGPLLWVDVDPRLDSIRNDPRFAQLRERIRHVP